MKDEKKDGASLLRVGPSAQASTEPLPSLDQLLADAEDMHPTDPAKWQLMQEIVRVVRAQTRDRDLLVRADSFLSLLWYRHTPAEIRCDFALSVDIERTIADLRRASKS